MRAVILVLGLALLAAPLVLGEDFPHVKPTPPAAAETDPLSLHLASGGTVAAPVTVNGLVHSTASGFRFPDATTQTTAATTTVETDPLSLHLAGGAQTIAADATWTLSGGVGGLNLDTCTVSVDALNNRMGLGTCAPATTLDVLAPAATAFGGNFALTSFTGSTMTAALGAGNPALGTGTAPFSSAVDANVGVWAQAYGVGAGTKVGLLARAFGSTGVNMGVAGYADGTASATTSIGVTGFVFAAGTNQYGGWFGVHSSRNTPAFGASAAIVADNGDQAVDILSLRDNTTEVFEVANGGAVTATQSLTVNGAVTLGDASSDVATVTGRLVLTPRTWAAADCDNVAELGPVMHIDGGSNVLMCICERTGASTYAFAKATANAGACP